MKYIILESQINNVRTTFLSSCKKRGLWETLNLYNLNFSSIVHLLGPIKLGIFQPNDYLDLIKYLIRKEKMFWKQSFSDGNYKIFFEFDSFTGTIIFVLENIDLKTNAFGYATPFWEGWGLPIEIDRYEDENGEIIELHRGVQVIYLKNKFQNVGELVEWFFKQYPFVVLESSVNYLKKNIEKY